MGKNKLQVAKAQPTPHKEGTTKAQAGKISKPNTNSTVTITQTTGTDINTNNASSKLLKQIAVAATTQVTPSITSTANNATNNSNVNAPAPKDTQPKEDAGLMPADGVSSISLPNQLAKATGLKNVIFLRPSKDMKLTKDSSFAIRANEKYTDIAAAFVNERGYVRNALTVAEKVYFYNSPGKNPIIVVTGYEEAFTLTPTPGKRHLDQVIKKTIIVEPAVTETFTVPAYTREGTLVRITCLTSDHEKLITAAKAAGVTPAVREGHVLGTTCLTVFATDSQILAIIRDGHNITPMDNITSSKKADQQFTLKFKETTSPAACIAAAAKIQQHVKGSFASFKTFNTLRIVLPSRLTPSSVRQVRMLIDPKLTKTYPITDVQLNAWETPAARNEDDDNIAEPKSVQEGQITRLLRSTYLPHKEEFEIVAKSINGKIAAFGTSKFSECVMTALVIWDKEFEAQVTKLENTKIITAYGEWYISSRDSNV